MKKVFAAILFIWVIKVGYSQSSSAGKCFYVDYVEWCNLNYPGIFINCGNDPSFNTGSELTLEVWVRAYIFGENRKLMGKMSASLNNGYVMGFENLNIYSEIFNPDLQVVAHGSTGPIPADSAWVHLVTTYNANGQMVNYLNGVNVGEVTVFPQTPIASNSEPFIIGLAPWDQLSFEFTGGLDEIRVWNVALTESQIQENMFRTLTGNEAGLVAYYNFSNDIDSVVHDLAPNALNGILKNSEATCFSWAVSDAPVGDSVMSTQYDLNASWYGKNPTQYTYAITTNGFSLITSISSKQYWNNVLFGHNNLQGKTNNDAPAGAPVDFERLSRVWYVNQKGTFVSQVIFNIQDAAAGGSAITSGGQDSLYTLLARNDTSGSFEAVCSASAVMGNTVLFDGVVLENKYYTLGYSSEVLAGPASIEDAAVKHVLPAYPNPATGNFYLDLPSASFVSVINIEGLPVFNANFGEGQQAIQLGNCPNGVYLIRIMNSEYTENQRIIIR
ncbi:MAG: hypothetical protein CVU11_13790 [Bacteroidetes bacterium HGW-Bacteroidetes-6]|nr:MAG: hypothetical protein CVU11_13790 [Bacteroidetes bacterium HGW-Bacteroidetes-6]